MRNHRSELDAFSRDCCPILKFSAAVGWQVVECLDNGLATRSRRVLAVGNNRIYVCVCADSNGLDKNTSQTLASIQQHAGYNADYRPLFPEFRMVSWRHLARLAIRPIRRAKTDITVHTFLRRYLLLTRLIRILGSKFCRFTPTLTGLVLAGSTIVAMSLQGAGAGLQASSRIPVSVSPGSYIILAGLALQILVMLVYLEILIELVWRARKGHPAIPFPRSRAVPNDITTPNSSLEKVERLLIATASSFILVFVRTCYRLVVLVLGRLSKRSTQSKRPEAPIHLLLLLP